MYKLFILMWMMGTKPKAWEESQTVPLHETGNKHDFGNWRPIELVIQLWTGLIAECSYNHAERFKLSSTEEGFRKLKNITWQLQNVINFMSDAKQANKTYTCCMWVSEGHSKSTTTNC